MFAHLFVKSNLVEVMAHNIYGRILYNVKCAALFIYAQSVYEQTPKQMNKVFFWLDMLFPKLTGNESVNFIQIFTQFFTSY